jgi:hypothetical protein
MKTMIFASILAVTAMVWTSQLRAEAAFCETDDGRWVWCGHEMNFKVGTELDKACQVSCANAVGPKDVMNCMVQKCGQKSP